jgi:asparagine synthase (glutamine-hydrolysing)
MCGLAGFLFESREGNKFNFESTLKKMSNAIIHRGPDDSGEWIDKSNGLGLTHRRLSIIDLSKAGHQPMISRSGRYVIAFNGVPWFS